MKRQKQHGSAGESKTKTEPEPRGEAEASPPPRHREQVEGRRGHGRAALLPAVIGRSKPGFCGKVGEGEVDS